MSIIRFFIFLFFGCISLTFSFAAIQVSTTEETTSKKLVFNTRQATPKSLENLEKTIQNLGGRLSKIEGGDFVGATDSLPTSDLRSFFSAVPLQDQGPKSSCAAFASAALAQCYWTHFQHKKIHDFAEEFLWSLTRSKEGHLTQDTGVTIPDVLSVLIGDGVCEEYLCMYSTSNDTKLPTPEAMDAAKPYALPSKNITALPNPKDMNFHVALTQSLTKGPVIGGIKLYDSNNWLVNLWQNVIEQQWMGIIPDPAPNDVFLGGHCILIVGFDGSNYIGRNSWGTVWGKSGYFTISQNYLSQYGFDYYALVPDASSTTDGVAAAENTRQNFLVRSTRAIRNMLVSVSHFCRRPSAVASHEAS